MEYVVNTLSIVAMSGRPREAGGEYVADPTAVPPGSGRAGYDSDLSEAGIRTDYWNWGEGFISTYPPDQFIMLENGALYGGQKDQVWAPYYTLHKIMAGLMDIYEVSGNKGTGNRHWYGRLDICPFEQIANRNSYQYVEHLHCRRIRWDERSNGKTL